MSFLDNSVGYRTFDFAQGDSQLKTMTAWCRSQMGKSHGQYGPGHWYVTTVFRPGGQYSFRRVVITHPEWGAAAALIWS